MRIVAFVHFGFNLWLLKLYETLCAGLFSILYSLQTDNESPNSLFHLENTKFGPSNESLGLLPPKSAKTLHESLQILSPRKSGKTFSMLVFYDEEQLNSSFFKLPRKTNFLFHFKSKSSLNLIVSGIHYWHQLDFFPQGKQVLYEATRLV